MKRVLLTACLLIPLATGFSQTLTDGLMMGKKMLCTGFLYTHDQWTDYWEGSLKRDNENIGTISTQSLMWMGTYGVTDKLNIIGMLPYVKTKASQGTITGLDGIQDITIGAKYNFYRKDYEAAVFKAFVIGSYGRPVSDYSFDLLPLSIGMGSQRLNGRLTLNYRMQAGFYINGSAGYTWRSNVTLDRPSYYTGNQLYLTDEVKMPNIFDYTASVGYVNKSIQGILSYSQQNTLGGADIRRQDMPFVSNRMNFSKVDALVMWYMPKPKNLALRGSVGYTVAGRNVGQSTTFLGGVLYTFHFEKQS
jgi:hypothetical protein